jgi:hypothetical protein
LGQSEDQAKGSPVFFFFTAGVVSEIALSIASVGNACLLTNALDMNKCDAPVSNKIQCCK